MSVYVVAVFYAFNHLTVWLRRQRLMFFKNKTQKNNNNKVQAGVETTDYNIGEHDRKRKEFVAKATNTTHTYNKYDKKN